MGSSDILPDKMCCQVSHARWELARPEAIGSLRLLRIEKKIGPYFIFY